MTLNHEESVLDQASKECKGRYINRNVLLLKSQSIYFREISRKCGLENKKNIISTFSILAFCHLLSNL